MKASLGLATDSYANYTTGLSTIVLEIMCICVCDYGYMCARECRCLQRLTAWNPWSQSYQWSLAARCREPSLNPLEEQYALLTTGPSLPSLELCFFWYLDNQMPGLEDSVVNFRSELPSLSFSIKTECWGMEFTLLFIHSWKSLRI